MNVELRLPTRDRFFGNITENATFGLPMVKPDSRVGKSVNICGAGPSLNDVSLPLSDEVWATNSALPHLYKQGVRVTHGFTIDQGPEMLGEWSETFPVEYLVASSVTPELVKHLKANKRKVRLFHNYTGISPKDDPEQEMNLYRTLYPTSVQAGHGLNAVPRAVCLAVAMGFKTIRVIGADCGTSGHDSMPETGTPEFQEWLKGLVVYADGRTGADCYRPDEPVAEAEIDGVRWHTRPDMIISARHLLELQEAFPGRIELIGKTLPNAFRAMGEEWMKGLPTLSRDGVVEGFGIKEAA
jgi:hypothetical protein